MGRLVPASLRVRLLLLVVLAVAPVSVLSIYTCWAGLGPGRRDLAGFGAASLAALGILWVGLDWLALRRVRVLSDVAERLGQGDLAARAPVGGRDELGLLAERVNVMAEHLETLVRAERDAKRALGQRVSDLVAQRTREVDLLHEMGQLLQACVSLNEAYTVVGRLVGQLFPHQPGALCVIRESRGVVQPVAEWGDGHASPAGTFGPQECWALRRGRVHVVEDTASGLLCAHVPRPAPAAYLCMPLSAQGETLGFLYLSAPAGREAGRSAVPEVKHRLAATVAEQLALTLANLRLRETLRNQSILDSLTGLYNRRYMEETLERELAQAARAKSALGLMMIDLDHFKRVNDGSGHEAGDAWLRELGRFLRGSLRGGDIACRYGGEEFVLILPEATREATCRRAEQLDRKSVV